MKRLLNSTAALSVALMHVQPWPVFAQTITDSGAIIAANGTVLCEPSAKVICDPANPDLIAQAQKIEAELAAEADAKAKQEAAAAQADAKAKQEAETAQADAKAKQEAETAEADVKAKQEAAAAQADAKAKQQAATAQADANAKQEAAAAEADAKAKQEAAAAQADAKTKQEAAAAEADVKAKQEAAAAEADAKAKQEAAAAEADAKAKQETAAAEADAKAKAPVADPNAGLKTAVEAIDPAAPAIDAPVVTDDEKQALSNLLSGAESGDASAAQPMAAADGGPRPADAAPSDGAVTATTEIVTDETSRSATQEFSAAPQVVAPGKKNRLSNLEKAGLIGLGALVVGAAIKQSNSAAGTEQPQQQVISNTGDRVIVQQPDGNYQVYKDDDALLRRPGNTLRTETYKDGSTLTTVDRADGTQVVTIRNATGRVLRRAHYDGQGVETVLFNDLEPEREIVVSKLPKPRDRAVVISAQDGDVAMKAALARRQIENIGRTFSLRQVRDIAQVRHLAAVIDVDKITFASGSSALTTTEVNALSDLGTVMQSILDANKNEIFLIEGHTDATGAAAMNLALSDRRAETVALALSEYFDIPPENMVVQGYGETELLIDTQADEQRNRRVGVRIITPLL